MPLAKLWKKLTKRKGSKKLVSKKVKAKSAKKPAQKLKKNPLQKARNKVEKAKEKTLPVEKPSEKPKEKEVGVVTHYFGKIQVGIVKVKSELIVGDEIHIKGVHDDFTQIIESMQYDHQPISSAKKGLEIGIKVFKPVHENDKVYK